MAFFTVDSLKKSVGSDGFEQLKDGAVDKGAAFLSGQVTTSMNKVMSDKTSVALINTASLGTGTYMTASALVKNPEILQGLATNIVAGAVDVATQETAKIAGKIVAKTVQIPLTIPAKIQQYTMEAFNAYKKSFGEILKEVMDEQGGQIENAANEQDEKSKKESNNKALEKLNKAKDTLTAGLEKLNGVLSKVSEYIEEGPNYIANEVDKQISSFVQAANKEVDKKIEVVEKTVDDECKSQGYKIGKRMAETYNETLRKQAKKQLASQKTAISKAKGLAFKAKQTAALQVMAMTGINVPV